MSIMPKTLKRIGLAVILAALTGCDEGPLKPIDGEGTPELNVTSVPPIGSFDEIKGNVKHVIASEYVVTVYIDVISNNNDSWWVKPYDYQPYVEIGKSGSWRLQYVTGGNDPNAKKFALYLVHASQKSNIPKGSAGNLGANLPDMSGLAVAQTVINR